MLPQWDQTSVASHDRTPFLLCKMHLSLCYIIFCFCFLFWIIHEKRIRHNQHALTETQSKGCFPNALTETQKLWFPKCFDWNSIKGVASQTFLLSDFSLIHLLVLSHLSSLLLSSNCLLHMETSLHSRFRQQSTDLVPSWKVLLLLSKIQALASRHLLHFIEVEDAL